MLGAGLKSKATRPGAKSWAQTGFRMGLSAGSEEPSPLSKAGVELLTSYSGTRPMRPMADMGRSSWLDRAFWTAPLAGMGPFFG